MRLKEIKMTAVRSLALASVLAALVVAQQPAKPGQEKHPGKQMMTMDEMMQECLLCLQRHRRHYVSCRTMSRKTSPESRDPL